MKISDVARYAFGFCAAAAILGGCSGQGQSPNPAAQTPIGNARPTALLQRVDANSSGNEVLTGRVRIECPSARFHARGKTAGPYPGTFIASGHWAVRLVVIGSQQTFAWDFKEKFAITSGASRVSGTIEGDGYGYVGCTEFGPQILQYTSNFGSGTADIELIQNGKGNFNETLEAM